MSLTNEQKVEFYGYTPVPRDQDVLFAGHPTATGTKPKQEPFTVDDFSLPSSELVEEVNAFAKVSVTALSIRDLTQNDIRIPFTHEYS